MKDNKIYAIFHIGRGGRFHNAGHIEFIGEKTIAEMEALCSDYLFCAGFEDDKFKEWFNTNKREDVYLKSDIKTREEYGITGPIFLEGEYSIGDAEEKKTAQEAAKYYGQTFDVENEEERDAILERIFADMFSRFEYLYEEAMGEALDEYNEKHNTRWFDANGKEVGEIGGGVLDFDGDFDTYYARDFEDLTEKEIEAIRHERMYISDELREACGRKRYTIRQAETGEEIEDVDTIDEAKIIIIGYLMDDYDDDRESGKIEDDCTFEDYRRENESFYEIFDNQKFQVVY